MAIRWRLCSAFEQSYVPLITEGVLSAMSDSPPPDPREMFGEISALMGSIAKAFGLDESAVTSALEHGDIDMSFETDSNGNRFVLAHYQDQVARLYPGAIKQESEKRH